MKDCILCSSLHDEVGDVCRVCAMSPHSELSYKNMMRGKKLHPCLSCERLTKDEDGSLCKICIRKRYPEYKQEEQVTKQRERIGIVIPMEVNWKELSRLAAVVTVISSVISLILYRIDFVGVGQLLLSLLLSPDVSYHWRIPIFFPFFFLSLGLGLHLLSKFYYGGFFTPITNIWRSIKINLERLSLSVKIRWNAFISRKRAIQAYKRKRAESYQGWKGEIKLEEPLLDDKATREYVRLNRAEPNLEEVQQQ